MYDCLPFFQRLSTIVIFMDRFDFGRPAFQMCGGRGYEEYYVLK